MPETIFAQATGHGRAGIAVVRISGREAFAAGSALAGTLPPPRVAGLRSLRHPVSGERLDDGVVLAFPGPASFTGEDIVELQVHGSVAVVRSICDALASLPELRLAQPGEFTRRALANGRMDLVQVEALGDLLAAETQAQHRLALSGLDGHVSQLIAGWRTDLLRALAFVEASIDFAEEDGAGEALGIVAADLGGVRETIAREVSGFAASERLRLGFEVAIVGPPNVGKSTLLNALARREAALVSETPGTTRDIIEVRMDVLGLPITFLDTAGIRSDTDELEALGIVRVMARAAACDLRVFVVERDLDAGRLGIEMRPGDLVLHAKADLRPGPTAVSGLTGVGIREMLERIAGELRMRVAGARGFGHARQQEALLRTQSLVDGAVEELLSPAPRVELAAEDLRGALRSLDFLMGRVDVEAVLDVVFGAFCIGK